MMFKGVKLEPGDFVAFRAKTVPLPEIQAAVIEAKQGKLEVFSSLLTPFQHNGSFAENEIDEVKVVYPAEIAIVQETKGMFRHGQAVSANINGEEWQGTIIAAFDSVIVAKIASGEFIVGGVKFFRPAIEPG